MTTLLATLSVNKISGIAFGAKHPFKWTVSRSMNYQYSSRKSKVECGRSKVKSPKSKVQSQKSRNRSAFDFRLETFDSPRPSTLDSRPKYG